MLDLAISPCPNDTFAFYHLLSGNTALEEDLTTRFADIEALNHLCLEGAVDICKVSFHAWLHLRDSYQLLSAGSALGFGCGPLIVAREAMDRARLRSARIAIPGKYTTAALLLRLYLGGDVETVEVTFDRIMPGVEAGDFDAGLIIHESRFTYARHGLVSLVDLGDWWEGETGCPIPLGGIVAARRLGPERIAAFDAALAESITLAYADRNATVPFMQQHAQEMEPEVMAAHVDLYVNDFTKNLGGQGFAALDVLQKKAAEILGL